MNIVVTDPDPAEQELLRELLRGQYARDNVLCFSDPLLAVKFAAGNPVDVLYTVTDMKRLNGFELAKMLRSFAPGLKLCFVADTERERTDAMRLMAESCILRPVTREAFLQAQDGFGT